jgi:hypothetical protein
MNPEGLPDLPHYPLLNHPSVERDGAFSKPGTIGKGGKWAPAKGTRFRSTAEKAGPGRPRKKLRDPRNVKFY